MFLARLLIAFLVPLAAAAQEARRHEFDIPKWFAESFLDFPDEVREAARGGKRLMVYFGQDGCPYCAALMNVNFGERDIVETTQRHFVAIALNLWGDRETVWMDGRKRSEKELGRFLKVQFTPTLLFLDESGGVALRVNGYQPPPRFRLALEYVARRLEKEKTFAAFVAERGTRAQGGAEDPGEAFPKTAAKLAGSTGRPAVVLFESRGCDACGELHAALSQREPRALLAALDTVRVDASGEAPLALPGGRTMTEAQYARSLGVAFTPTLVFLDADRREIFRIEGYVRPFHLVSSLDYVVSGAWRTEPSFQRFLQARAERERAAGRTVELW